MDRLKMVLEWADDVKAFKPVGMDVNTDMYDYAILGITDDGKLVYSKDEMIRILSKQSKMSWEDASEFLEFNCFSAYVGEMKPIYVNQFS
jgi:hypothetical protein